MVKGVVCGKELHLTNLTWPLWERTIFCSISAHFACLKMFSVGPARQLDAYKNFQCSNYSTAVLQYSRDRSPEDRQHSKNE